MLDCKLDELLRRRFIGRRAGLECLSLGWLRLRHTTCEHNCHGSEQVPLPTNSKHISAPHRQSQSSERCRIGGQCCAALFWSFKPSERSSATK